MGDDYLNFRIGDLVTRISHKHDILFKIVNFEGNTVFLKGVDLRLVADSDVSDLVKASDYSNDNDKAIIEENVRDLKLIEVNIFICLAKYYI